MNPAIDKTTEVESITVGGLNRLENVSFDVGGKGVNVSKMIMALGGDSVATGFLGGGAGKEIESALQGLQIKTDFVITRHPTRTNLKVINREGVLTEFNEPGAVIMPDEESELHDKLLYYAKPGVLFVLAGSIPRGVDTDVYKRVTCAVKKKGASVFLDADGDAFRHAVDAMPDFIKPNRFELCQYFKKNTLLDKKECAELCRELVSKGITLVALSLGAEGAMFVTDDMALYAPGLSVQALSTVGAGDSMVGALAYGLGKGMSLKEAATLSVACSAGAVMTQGTNPPGRDRINELLKLVKLERVDI